MFTKLLRPIGLCVLLVVPALMVRLSGAAPSPVVGLLLFGMAVVAASFILAWAAEAAQVDISGGLAIAIPAVIAVLPEYAVDLYFAYTAGANPEYVAYAAANMTGSNRLLLGLGWAAVVLLGLALARKRTGKTVRPPSAHFLPATSTATSTQPPPAATATDAGIEYVVERLS